MSDLDAIDAQHEAFLAAFNAGDADGIAALVADDAVFMPPNVPRRVARGKGVA